MTRDAEHDPREDVHHDEQPPLTVQQTEGQPEYLVSGIQEALLEAGARLYNALGGVEESPDDCKRLLNNHRELRPRSGVFAIRFTSEGLLVENRNMKNDAELNALLTEAIKKETNE